MATFLLDSSSYGSNNTSSDPNTLTCRHCYSPNLTTDWAAGDVICTDCGIVSEERIRDATAEWKEFHDDADLAKGAPSLARCGMVANNESQWVGGLEPTTLSRQPYGGPLMSGKTTTMALRKVQRKVDKLIDKQYKESLKEAELARKILAKRREEKRLRRLKHQSMQQEGSGENKSENTNQVDDGTNDEDSTDEIEHEQESARTPMQEKWSLHRALLLHNYEQEQHTDRDTHTQRLMQQHQQDLVERITYSERKALVEIYQAYQMLQRSCVALSLTNTVLEQAAVSMCEYAVKINGINVRGISTKGPSANGKDVNDNEVDQQNASADHKMTVKQINKLRQMGALASALIYIHAKRLGCSRSLAHVCSTLDDQCSTEFAATCSTESSIQKASLTSKEKMVKPKTCSKAIAELKIHFPALFYISSSSPSTANTNAIPTTAVESPPTAPPSVAVLNTNDTMVPLDPANPAHTAASLVQHSTNLLKLSEEATLVIQHLALHIGKEQMEKGVAAGTKPSTICAALTYLVCCAGSIMQRLANQAIESAKRKQKISLTGGSSSESVNKRAKLNFPAKTEELCKNRSTYDANNRTHEVDLNRMSLPDDITSKHDAHDAQEDTETLQRWYEWTKQRSWDREYTAIERACGASRKFIYEYYKTHLYPKRLALLGMANDVLVKKIVSNTNGSIIRGCCLTNIATAAPLMALKKPK